MQVVLLQSPWSEPQTFRRPNNVNGTHISIWGVNIYTYTVTLFPFSDKETETEKHLGDLLVSQLVRGSLAWKLSVLVKDLCRWSSQCYFFFK